jgi:cytochrome c-type biogenesis protein CcmE
VTRKRHRLFVVLAGMATLGVAAALVLSALDDNLVFFHSPSDVAAKEIPPDRHFRLGGLVEEESVERDADGLTVRFRVTDLRQSIAVSYTGMLPDLFAEGQGVVAEGRLDGSGVFIASEVLAKHDENYLPPEVAEALKKSGRWQESEGR